MRSCAIAQANQSRIGGGGIGQISVGKALRPIGGSHRDAQGCFQA
jgi:hypothetical protein